MKNFYAIGLLLFLLVGWASGSLAQTFHPPIVNYSPQDYGADKTPENWDITQDHRGIVYSAVGNGILEFDGINWRFITVKNGAYTVSLDTDTSGVVYTGTSGDFGYLAPDKKGELKFKSLLHLVPDSLRNFSLVWETKCTDKGVMFQSDEYIFIYKDDKIAVYTPYAGSGFHTAFYIDGEFYARQTHLGLTKLVDGDFEYMMGTDTLAEMGVFGMEKVAGGVLLITREDGIWKMDNSGNLHKLRTKIQHQLEHAAVLGAKRLSSGSIAINTIEQGVFVVDQEGRLLHKINKRTGIRVNDVKSIYEDRENNLWLALNNGISKVNYHSPLSFYSEEMNLEGSVADIIRFNGRLLVGTSSGFFLNNLDASSNKEFVKLTDIHSQVWSFLESSGRLLIATSDGLYELSEDMTGVSKRYARGVNALVQSETTGDLIMAGEDGFMLIDGNSFEELEFIPSQISGITDMLHNPKPIYSDEEIWFGTNDGVVMRIQVTDWEYSYASYWGEADGLPDNQWVRPFIFEDSVFFGTVNGLYSFKDEHEFLEPGQTLDEYEVPLKGMFLYAHLSAEHEEATKIRRTLSHLADSEERAWTCIDRQIGYLDKQRDFKEIIRPFWGINFGRVNRFRTEPGNQLWIGTADGLIRYKPNNLKDYSIPFFSIIRAVMVGEDSTLYAGGDGRTSKNTGVSNELEYDFNSVTFHFAAPYFEDDHKVEFSYMLVGHDEDWSSWKYETQAKYTNLREGTYTFKVKAKNVYEQESTVAEYTFTILPPWYRTTWAYVGYGILGIIVLFIAIRLGSLRLKKQNERLERIVTERTQEIAEQNATLKEQKDKIEEHQKEIMDSINYAQRIQQAILPIEEEIKTNFPDSFVLFLPKDIVSGDFYWFAKVDHKLILVCADCTGHGVPGAFMSMIGTDKLNLFVKARKITSPSEILAEMNRGIKSSLKQEADDEDSTRDGMDAAICTFDLNEKTVEYAGANRPLWLLRNGEIEEIKPTKVAVAGHTADDQIYEKHTLQLQEGDRLYMSSDGYADQFGGEKGKKLKVKAMKTMLLESTDINLTDQRELLYSNLTNWMGNYEQIDDVCVIGVRV